MTDATYGRLDAGLDSLDDDTPEYGGGLRAADGSEDLAYGREEDSLDESGPLREFDGDEDLGSGGDDDSLEGHAHDVRERIFARVRRPAAAPYGADFEEGAAERLARYEGEDVKAGAWRLGAAGDCNLVTTRYDDPDTVSDRAMTPGPFGTVLDPNGRPLDGTWGWVVDERSSALLLFDPVQSWVRAADGSRREYAGESLAQLLARVERLETTHHTTPVAGLPVKGAGIMELRDGVIVSITDHSGHYQPNAVQHYDAITALQDEGFGVTGATKIGLSGVATGPRPSSKDEWLHEAAAHADAVARDAGTTEPVRYPLGQVDLRYAQFEQTQGDEHQIRLKQMVNAQIRAREGATRAGAEGDSSSEDDHRSFVIRAREYLATAGRGAFAEWFATLSAEHQHLLSADEQIKTGFGPGSPAAPAASARPAWQPAEADLARAARANAAFVDRMGDRHSAVFNLAGFSLLIGDGHAGEHVAYVDAAADFVEGTVTVRKAGLGRGAGALTFKGVPPAKQEIVRAAVARFSRKQVSFG